MVSSIAREVSASVMPELTDQFARDDRMRAYSLRIVESLVASGGSVLQGAELRFRSRSSNKRTSREISAGAALGTAAPEHLLVVRSG